MLSVLGLERFFWRVGIRSMLQRRRGKRCSLCRVLLLVDDTHRVMMHGRILQVMRHGLRASIVYRMVEPRGVLVRGLRRVHRRRFRRMGKKLLVLEGQLLSVVVGIVELGSRWLVDLRVGAVEPIRTYTVQLQADACRAGPGVGCCCIAFDLPPSTPLTCSHHYARESVLYWTHEGGGRWQQR